MDLGQLLNDPKTRAKTCSAKKCGQPAVWALQWNNPKLHTPDYRKTWLACEVHLQHLTDYLSLRSFLRETVPADSLP